MQLLGIGDLHLSSVNGAGGLSRFLQNSDAVILNEVERVLEREDIDTVLLYGDICDSSRMSYNAHELLYALFKRHSDRFFHIILGNHDKFAKDSDVGHSCQLLMKMGLNNIRVYENQEVVKIGNSRVNMMPYPCADFKKGMLNVCHLTLSGAVDDHGRICKDGVEYKKGCPIVCGHIHSGGEGNGFSYSGTLYQLNFGESLERKGYHVINIDGADVDVLRKRWVPEYQLHTIEVTKDTDFSELANHKYFYRLVSDEVIDPALYHGLNVVTVKSKEAVKVENNFELRVEDASVNTDSLFNSILRKYNKEERIALKRVRAEILR